MPGWQEAYAQHKDAGFEILSIACDAQGPDVARPFHEAAGAEFVTVIDHSNVFGSLYGLRAVPFGVYIDEQGRIAKPPHGISPKPEVLEELGRWIAGEQTLFKGQAPERDVSDPALQEADLRFGLGSFLLAQGRPEEAMAEWRRALLLDAGNWIIHKQIWAVEHPEAFYEGPVDYAWQKQQLDREQAAQN